MKIKSIVLATCLSGLSILPAISPNITKPNNSISSNVKISEKMQNYLNIEFIDFLGCINPYNQFTISDLVNKNKFQKNYLNFIFDFNIQNNIHTENMINSETLITKNIPKFNNEINNFNSYLNQSFSAVMRSILNISSGKIINNTLIFNSYSKSKNTFWEENLLSLIFNVSATDFKFIESNSTFEIKNSKIAQIKEVSDQFISRYVHDSGFFASETIESIEQGAIGYLTQKVIELDKNDTNSNLLLDSNIDYINNFFININSLSLNNLAFANKENFYFKILNEYFNNFFVNLNFKDYSNSKLIIKWILNQENSSLFSTILNAKKEEFKSYTLNFGSTQLNTHLNSDNIQSSIYNMSNQLFLIHKNDLSYIENYLKNNKLNVADSKLLSSYISDSKREDITIADLKNNNLKVSLLINSNIQKNKANIINVIILISFTVLILLISGFLFFLIKNKSKNNN